MNLKKTVLLLAAVAVVGTGGVMAASAPGYGRGMVDVEVILMSSQTAGYRTYYNEPFGYSLDIPDAASDVEPTSSGDGCYFQDPKAHAVISVYGTKNMMNFAAAQLYRIDLSRNGNPTLTKNELTDKSYVISWVKKDKVYYEAVCVNDNGTYTSFSVVYPVKEKATYDAYCTHMQASFIPTGAVYTGK